MIVIGYPKTLVSLSLYILRQITVNLRRSVVYRITFLNDTYSDASKRKAFVYSDNRESMYVMPDRVVGDMQPYDRFFKSLIIFKENIYTVLSVCKHIQEYRPPCFRPYDEDS